jgi:effector-binding domain-containing protein
MHIKQVKPGNFLLSRADTTVAGLIDFLPVAQQLYAEAVNRNLRINGAVQWHYHGFTGDLTKPFTLEVCLPIQEVPQQYDGLFHVKRAEPFKCVSVIHEGGWMDIPATYAKIGAFINENKLIPQGVNREIYIVVDLDSPGANVTEVQVGVQ